ncbi:MAG: hypothetical protein ACRD8O_22650 [Bryobacteraceae bacterium]
MLLQARILAIEIREFFRKWRARAALGTGCELRRFPRSGGRGQRTQWVGAPGPPSLLRNYGASKTLSAIAPELEVNSRASGGGWRARQDSNLRPPA